jgi:OOP family OmpA-OmpF porin
MKNICITVAGFGLILLSINANAFKHPKLINSKKANHPKTYVKGTDAKKGPKKNYSMAELSKNIEYDFGKISIRNGYTDKLDQLAKILVDNKSTVALRGYADSIGSFKGNWVISDLRAKAVKGYLVKNGVDSSRVVTTAFGSTKPVASNKTKAGRQKNRRVEIRVN